MHISIFKKFLLLYIFVGCIGFILISNICYSLDYRAIIESRTEQIYNQAVSISKDYASTYFSDEKIRLIRSEMITVASASGERIMFIDTDGNILMDTSRDITGQNSVRLNDFDYTRSGSRYSQSGRFFDYFSEDMLSVMAPITNAYTVKGYVAIHIPLGTLRSQVYTTFNTNYVTFIIMMMLILLFVAFYFIMIHRPLKAIIKGVDEYSKGNLDYRIDLAPGDELHRLGASLNYMSSEINEMDKFQQKFISNISHDFRSPLTSIKGYLEAMSDGTIPPELHQKYIGIVLFETERLTKLTNNLLTLNDLDPKSVRLNYSDFDINDVIRHTIETFEGVCTEKKITFKLTFSSRQLMVHADMEKIQQVVYNLVDNAVKFSHPDSFIAISTTTKNGRAFISVKDNGIGIPKDDLKKIWERFYKTDNSRGRDKKGSGLGLAIVREIIQTHGERIDVISTEGVGTEFVFSLKTPKSTSSS